MEDALGPILCVINEDIKDHWSQNGPMRDINSHQCPSGHGVIGHYPLDSTTHLITYPSNSSSIKPITLQYKQKDVVEEKALEKSSQLTAIALTLFTHVITLSQATRLVRQDLPLVKPKPFLSPMCLSRASSRIHSLISGTEVRLKDQ
ncbi:hypothetical protein TURU_045891 [Turdus rufiventris]|nr:hypothetical protein TURU_045891 [Turdus rufiventris]